MVVEETAARFLEGRVTSVANDRVTVQSQRGAQSVTVSVADIYRLPAARAALGSEDLAICRQRPSEWVPCRIESVLEGRVLALAGGRKRSIGSADVLEPSALTRLNLERFFRLSDKRAAFGEAVKQAGRPRAPEGWRPLPRERVLGKQDSGWFSATIREIGKRDLRVDWLVDGRTSDVDWAEVVPEPPYPVTLHRGDHALARPERSSDPWAPVRVESVEGPDALTVVGIDDRSRTLTVRDLVPLVSTAESSPLAQERSADERE